MKVQSKKDQYTVRCENQKQTCDVLNYIEGDNDRSWSHWEYVTQTRWRISDINDCNKYEYPVISFEEWEKLTDVYKPDPKDMAFNNEFETKCGWNKMNEHPEPPKKIIGYKLIKPEYKEAVNALISQDKDSNWILLNTVKSGNALWEDLYLTGVLDIWFEPVYDKSITLKSGVKLSEDDIAEVKEILNNK